MIYRDAVKSHHLGYAICRCLSADSASCHRSLPTNNAYPVGLATHWEQDWLMLGYTQGWFDALNIQA
ncbi:hypothetical protein ACT691_13135 [Vibrio metschnikovii]